VGAAKVAVLVAEDTALGRRAYLTAAGEPRACLVIGERGELAVFGHPAAMRRLSVAVRDAAHAADRRCVRGEPVEDRGPAAA
jgi:hypothetical protein